MAETAELAVRLKLDDDLSPGLRKVDKSVKGVGTGFDKAGKRASAFGGTMKKAAVIGAGALAGGLALAIRSGLQDLATLETATTSVTGAIQTMGLTGKVTANQIAGWANDIESDIGAAFDDKDITAATATLIRFGHVVPQNIRPAMVVMTDLAAKTGDVASASSLLSKALADPAKAAGKLARVGVILTKSQQDQIKALVKAGKVGQAQTVVLDAIAKSTKGAAAASQGPYQRALSTLADVSEDARKALAEGFLPVIERVAMKLSKVLADPKAIESIRTFGKSLADGFDSAVKLAEGVDWGKLSDGLQSAAGWAKRLFDAFQALPPEAKGLILALGGITKLTGGAPIKIAVDFAKDALGGVFGHFFDRGSSPANPMFVSGAGIGGVGGGAAGGVAGKVGEAAGLVGVAALGVGIAEVFKQGTDQLAGVISGGDARLESGLKLGFDLSRAQAFGPFEALRRLPEDVGNVASWVQSLVNHTDAGATRTALSVDAAKNAITSNERGEGAKHRAALAQVVSKEQASIIAFRAGERAQQTGNSLSRTANARLEAIKNKRTKFTVNTNVAVNTRVSVSELQRQARYTSRVARTTGLSAS